MSKQASTQIETNVKLSRQDVIELVMDEREKQLEQANDEAHRIVTEKEQACAQLLSDLEQKSIDVIRSQHAEIIDDFERMFQAEFDEAPHVFLCVKYDSGNYYDRFSRYNPEKQVSRVRIEMGSSEKSYLGLSFEASSIRVDGVSILSRLREIGELIQDRRAASDVAGKTYRELDSFRSGSKRQRMEIIRKMIRETSNGEEVLKGLKQLALAPNLKLLSSGE